MLTALRTESAASRNVMGTDVRIFLRQEDTGGSLFLAQIIAPPGTGVPPHTHTREEETFHILKGAIRITIGGRTQILRQGDTLCGVRDVEHSWWVEGDETAHIQLILTPAGMERMFDEIHDLTERTQGNPPMPEVLEICARHGVYFGK